MTARARAALTAAAAALLAVSAAYQIALPVTIEMGGGLPSARLTRDLHQAEDGFRWTREESHVLMPGPGPFRRVQLQATVSAWRPRGQALPLVTMAAGGATAALQTTPRPQVAVLDAATRGVWSPTVDLTLASAALPPGRSDARHLGVRLHRVRLATPSVFSPGLPPLLPLLLAALLAAAVSGTALRRGAEARSAARAGEAAAVLAGLALAFARALAVVLLPAAVALALAALLTAAWWTKAARGIQALVAGAARQLRDGAAVLGGRAAVAVMAAALAGSCVATIVRPTLDLPLGTGREEPFARGLRAYDGAGGVAFRHAGPDAALDLRGLGAGRWSVQAFDPAGAPVPVALVPADGAARVGWRPGPIVTFPGAPGDLHLARVQAARGRALPAARVAVASMTAALLVALALAAAGCRRRSALAVGLAMAVAWSAALAVDPVLATPFATRLALVAAAAAVFAALVTALDLGLADGGRETLPAAARAIAALAFLAWLAAPLTPLYRGGHFVFHCSIAEEIWQGRLLLYALPYPGSMLSQQAQWGNVVVPHPCLFHVVVAPLAALPRPWFFAAVKAVLALWLAGMALCAARVAQRLAGPAAAVYAAAVVALTPATFQLVGLGHLMTIFGCWAMTLAVAMVALRFEQLRERPVWWTAVALLALCFLSYTAALLFTMVAFALALPWLLRRHRQPGWALVRATATAAAAAFFIYYVYWAWPFLSQSVPRLLHGGAAGAAAAGPAAAGGERALAARLLALPHKLGYTFGTPLVPLLGLFGLALAAAAGAPAAVLMAAWGTVFVLFCGADLFFNFLLKHHYFAIVPMAVGLGVVLERVARWPGGRWIAAALLLGLGLLAGRVALAVATGGVP